ncbi:hypothetical protein RRG08_054678 [Elysia crispata]|uniref:Uncharacterized protein n=1 Tax=Elysia crispata TaxID=231223 RepID=A0AAE1E7W0_9GAST|nr:hypothetical protein RRG08_054678 [Elysia crispata]
MWYVISVLLTVFAAVQKCSCIALPLVFGHFFTQRRTVAVVITIFIVTITYHIPGLSLYRWGEYFDHRRNRTRRGYGWINRPLGLKLNITTDWINFIFVPFTSEGVIIVCVIIMTMKLRQAATSYDSWFKCNTWRRKEKYRYSFGHPESTKPESGHIVFAREHP